MREIKLTEEKETLLIPLYSKAAETKKENPIIYDQKAVEIINKIEYDFSALKIPMKTHITICIRAKQFDNYVKKYLDTEPRSNVINLGCGLDSRFDRVDNGTVEWYDLDFLEVIQLRNKFFKETKRYHLIPSSVTDYNWINQIENKSLPTIVLAEGLFMYLKEQEIKELLQRLRNSYSGYKLIFDSFSKLTAKNINKHPSIKKTGAHIHWGIDNAKEIESWGKGINLTEEWYFSQSEEIKKLSGSYRLIFKIAGLFSTANKAHRILAYEVK